MVTPTPHFNVGRRILGEVSLQPGRVVAVVASGIVLGGVQLYLTWLLKQWVEGPISSGDLRGLVPLIAEGLAAMCVGMVALFLSRYLAASIDQRIVESLRTRAVGRILQLDLLRAREFKTGDVMARVLSDAGMLGSYVGTIGRRVVHEAIVVVGALAMLFVLEWRLAAATCALVPVTAVILDRLGRVIRRSARAAQDEVGTLGAMLDEQLHGLTTIKAFQAEAVELDRFARRSRAVRSHILRSEFWSGVLLAVVFVLTGIGLVGIVWYGTTQLGLRHIGPGTLFAFALYAGQIVEPLRRLSELQGSLQVVLSAAGRLYEVVDRPGVESERPGGRLVEGAPAASVIQGGVSFEGLRFGYGPERLVLDGIDLRIPPRSRVALVGATGAGKSTIAGLLVRFVVPTEGTIAIDGRSIDDIPLASLRRAVCVVEQDPFIFSGPLADNIRYGSWDADAETVRSAARMTGLDGLIERLPGGLDGVLVEAGRHLSGGEKQRIALARAVVRDPAVLVLDEATSAIDSETEAAVFTSLEAWMARRTVVQISHRLSTVLRFPRLVMIDGGHIAADGRPADILKENAACGALFADQSAPFSVR